MVSSASSPRSEAHHCNAMMVDKSSSPSSRSASQHGPSSSHNHYSPSHQAHHSAPPPYRSSPNSNGGSTHHTSRATLTMAASPTHQTMHPPPPPPAHSSYYNYNHNHHYRASSSNHHARPAVPILPAPPPPSYAAPATATHSSYGMPYGVPSSTAAAAPVAAVVPYRFETPAYVYGMPSPLHLPASAGCTCKKSRCLKLYCQCFSSSTTCGPKCRCGDCRNTTAHSVAIEDARQTILLRNPGAFEKGLVRNYSHHHMAYHVPPPPPHMHLHQAHYSSAPWPSAAAWPTQQSQHHDHHHSAAGHSASPVKAIESTRSSLSSHSSSSSSAPGTHQSPSKSNASGGSSPEKSHAPLALSPPPMRIAVAPMSSNNNRANSQLMAEAATTTAHHPPLRQKNSAPKSPAQQNQENSLKTVDGRVTKASPESQSRPRRISLLPSSSSSSSHEDSSGETDTMTILAAVAMTELLNGFSSPGSQNDSKTNDTPLEPSDKAKTSSPSHGTSQKRKNESPSSNNSTTPTEKRSRHSPKHDVVATDEDDEVVRHVVSSSTSFVSVESRDSSPGAAPETTAVPAAPATRYTHEAAHNQEHRHEHHQHNGQHVMTAGAPPMYGSPPHYNYNYYVPPHQRPSRPFPAARTAPTQFRALPTRQSFVSSNEEAVEQPQVLAETAATTADARGTSPGGEGQGSSPQNASRTPHSSRGSYVEVTRSCGLPKSLSFRKICSRCGKTRGEHGEMGFGNKCVYSDCGKCGAGIHWHNQAGEPMGILCQLTVEQGAVPGANAAYERKIRDLAARADLQRFLEHRRKSAAAASNCMPMHGLPRALPVAQAMPWGPNMQ